jgi:hypothetical protein
MNAKGYLKSDFVKTVGTLCVLIASAVWFLLSNFPTLANEEKALSNLKSQMDIRMDAQQNTLGDIKNTVLRIDQRVYDLYRTNQRSSNHGR